MVQGPKHVPLLRRLLAAVVVGALAFGALISFGSAATAATTRTVSIVAKPSAAVVGKTVTMSGTLTNSPKGSTVTVQRKSGTSWVTVKTVKTTTATGKYAARITLPTKAGNYSYRALAPAKGSLRTAVSPVIKVGALTPVTATIKATPKPPATLTAGAKATVSGAVKPFVTGTTVTIQRFGSTGKWVSTGFTAKVTSKGTFTVQVVVKDGSVFRVYVPRAGLKAPAVSGPTAVIANPAIKSTSLPVGSKNTAYAAQLTQVGTNPGTWSVSPALPAGLSLNSNSGAISGTPTGTSSKDYTFSFAQPGLVTATKVLTLTITPPVPPTITTAALTNAKQGVAYSQTLIAQGNPAGTWTASPLPAGLSLVTSTGVISGTPTTPGTTQVTIGFKQTSTQLSATPKTLDLVVVPPPTITTSSLTSGRQGTSYTETLVAQGNPAGTWTASPLPAGLTLAPATGVISGTPTAAGTTHVTIGFTQTSTGLAATPKTLDLVITPPPPVISTSSVPNGHLFTAYSFQLTAEGNPAGTWSGAVSPSGSGFTVTAAGVLKNAFPVKAGVYTVTVNFTATGNPTPAEPVQLTLTVS